MKIFVKLKHNKNGFISIGMPWLGKVAWLHRKSFRWFWRHIFETGANCPSIYVRVTLTKIFIMFYKTACIGLFLLFVSCTLGQQQCYVNQHCSSGEVCHKQERESRFFILGICIKLIDMVRPKKPCKSHKDCRWYLGKYCDKKAGFCKMIIGWYLQMTTEVQNVLNLYLKIPTMNSWICTF